MPLPKGLARFNRVVTNKIARPSGSAEVVMGGEIIHVGAPVRMMLGAIRVSEFVAFPIL